MAEAEYSTTAKLPVQTIWEFVQEMDNWAHFLTGYQSHEKQSETDSVWTLKGDVGVLARVVTFRVQVTEWNGPERVSFALQGVNEPMQGEGTFTLSSWEDTESAAPSPAKQGWLRRVIEAIFRFFFRLRHGSAERATTADAGPGEGMARLHFRLKVEPGGPMAPMVNALMQPAMLPAAEDLANRIMAHLETQSEALSKAQSETKAESRQG